MLPWKFGTIEGKTFVSANFQREEIILRQKTRLAQRIVSLFLPTKGKALFSSSFTARPIKFSESLEYSYYMLPSKFSSDRANTFFQNLKFCSKFRRFFANAIKKNFCKNFNSWNDKISWGCSLLLLLTALQISLS